MKNIANNIEKYMSEYSETIPNGFWNGVEFGYAKSVMWTDHLIHDCGLDDLMKDLRSVGYSFTAFEKVNSNAKIILLAEAANWAAKVIDSSYYELKAELIRTAIVRGIRCWVSTDEWSDTSIFYLYDKEVGVASFHDPFDSVNYCQMMELSDYLSNDNWNFPWSGIRRQNLAFDLLGDENLLKEMAILTRPRKLVTSQEIYDLYNIIPR